MAIIISILIIVVAIWIYIYITGKKSRKTQGKIDKARKYGLHEPVSIHPFFDPALCIGSGACAKACPEKDVIGIVNGKGALVNTSHCVGHGACAQACPVGAIKLVFGSETRGVDIPYVTPNFETNVKGIFIVGELGGMGLIKNATIQGREAVEYISCLLRSDERKEDGLYDVLIVGAGPAGISASLAALKNNLKYVTIEQEDIGGTVLSYPRNKIVMTSPVDLPMYGKVKMTETTKEALLDLWTSVIKKTGLKINTFEKMTGMAQENGFLKIITSKGEYLTKTVVLAIGRRGTPRKLGVPGENSPKVYYRLLEPEQHQNQDVLVVGGGDSAIEAALAVTDQPDNRVTLSYRGESFSRIKQKNSERLNAILSKKSPSFKVIFNSNVKEIGAKEVKLMIGSDVTTIPNDYVYVFAGGELPTEFLKNIGVQIEKKFGKA